MNVSRRAFSGTRLALLLGLAALLIALIAAAPAGPLAGLASEFTVGDSAVTTVGDTAVHPAQETATFVGDELVAATYVVEDFTLATLDDSQAVWSLPMTSVDDDLTATIAGLMIAIAILGGLFLTLTDKRYPLKLLTDVVGSFWHRGMRFLLSVITGGARTSRRLVAPLAAVFLALAWTSSSAFAQAEKHAEQASTGIPIWSLVALGLGSVALVGGGLVTRRASK
jgi:hypothetical protein